MSVYGYVSKQISVETVSVYGCVSKQMVDNKAIKLRGSDGIDHQQKRLDETYILCRLADIMGVKNDF